jgi:hypothetical protein
VKLLWSAFALADRDGIFTHIQADNPRAAIAVDERIAAAARRLVDVDPALDRQAGVEQAKRPGEPDLYRTTLH